MDIDIGDNVTISGVVSEIISDNLIEVKLDDDWHIMINKEHIKKLHKKTEGNMHEVIYTLL